MCIRHVVVAPQQLANGYESLFAKNYNDNAELKMIEITKTEFSNLKCGTQNGVTGKWFGGIFIPILALRHDKKDAEEIHNLLAA